MPTIRDALLPTVDQLRGISSTFGIRRYAVTIRTRTWSGTYAGEGVATDSDLVITPAPRVRFVTTQEVASSGGTYREGDILITSITPSYGTGGFTPAQLDPKASQTNKDVSVILVGDEGTLEAELIKIKFERPMTYSMVVRLVRGSSRG